MTQVSLVDSVQLSSLLQDALASNDTVTSLLVSARNGSILAYAFRNTTPSIKAMRTRSTTMTAAYSIASENVLVFEAQNSRALTVIAPIADHILLAVSGAEPTDLDPYEQHVHNTFHTTDPNLLRNPHNGESVSEDEEGNYEEDRERIRSDLEQANQELAHILKEELAGLRWPDDI